MASRSTCARSLLIRSAPCDPRSVDGSARAGSTTTGVALFMPIGCDFESAGCKRLEVLGSRDWCPVSAAPSQGE